MHIPDGFLNIATVGTTYAISAGGVGYGLREEAARRMADKSID